MTITSLFGIAKPQAAVVAVACRVAVCALVLGPSIARANPPIAQYIFPAGARQGTTVAMKVGGLDLGPRCGFEMLGPGIEVSKQLERTKTIWFEGPVLPLPESQQQEDYPKDMAGKLTIAADAVLGIRHARVWTSQGASAALKFIVGDLPEVIEDEIDGEPVPVDVKLPVTINGRIFPREDTDVWSFEAKKGQIVWCEVNAARLGSPLDSILEVLDPSGRTIAENDDAFGSDSFLRFTAPQDGKYQVRIRDVNFRGGQAYVYRLTLSSGPRVDRVYPLGGRRGATTRFELAGSGLADKAIGIPIPVGTPHEIMHQLSIADVKTNPFLLDTDDLPEHLEAEPNDTPEQVKPIAVPAVLNGRIDKPGDRDWWAFTLKKGEAVDLELRAQRLGSSLLGVLTMQNAKGEVLPGSGDGLGTDPRLRFTAKEDGTYYVCVADRFPNRGGPDFAYRLRVVPPPAPGFRLELASDTVTLPREEIETPAKGKARNRGKSGLKLKVERVGGFNGAINLRVDGLPPEVTITNPTIAANQANIDLHFSATEKARIGASRLTIVGTAKVGDRTIEAKAALPVTAGASPFESVLLAVALPTPFKIVGDHDFRWAPRGTVLQRSYKIERQGYQGPITINLADRQARHIQGVTGSDLIVPAGAKEFSYGVYLPPWMEMGRTSRTCIAGTATIKDTDGSEHFVSYSSVQGNDQLIAVVGPERLCVDVEKPSFIAEAGRTHSLSVKVTRSKDLKGAVKVELILPAHLQGVSAEAITIAADRSHGTLPLKFAAKPGPFNAPIILRATVMEKDGPVIGETRLEILPPD